MTTARAGAIPIGTPMAIEAIDRLPLNAADYERLARTAMGAGLAGYVTGGAGDEWTLRENRAALARWSLCPRVGLDVEHVETAVALFGAELSMPLLVAPLAFLGLGSGDGEIAAARAAARAGTVLCLSTFATVSPAQLARAAPRTPFWFGLYPMRDRGLTTALVEQAGAAGASAIVLTLDAPRIGYRERDRRNGFAIAPTTPIPVLEELRGRRGSSVADIFEAVDPKPTWARAQEIASLADVPVLVKGVLAPEDGRLAHEHGAAGIIVSNHGGRQLDGALASVDALAEVVDAVGGRVPVLVDGGVRRGADIVRALALGADAALVGRPAFWAFAARGERGVAHLLALLRDELELALALVGCRHPREVGRRHLRASPRGRR